MKKMLEQAGRKFPHAIAILSEKNKITYQELNRWAESLSPEITARKHNCIPIAAKSSAADIIMLWTVWRAGKTAVLVNTRIPEAEAARQIKFLHKARFKNAATILFTSGSSASPKAVVLTHTNHYYNALGSQENIPLHVGDRWLLSLPLYHVSGLSILYRCCLAGATLVVPSPGKDILQNIRDFKITHISFVATQLYRLLQDKKNIPVLRRLKAILLGGGPIPNEISQAAMKHQLPIHLTYGLTETASQVATSSIQDRKARKLFAVRTLPYRQVKFLKSGEICVKGKILSPGYATRRGHRKVAGHNGWFATGDMGKEVSPGRFIVLGRKDNMFISGGENIYPEEIERILLGHPSVQHTVVVPQPDREFGMRPVALCKFQNKTKVTKKILQKFLKQRLPKYKIPTNFYKIGPLGKLTADGIKISRRSLTDLWRAHPEKFKQI